MRDVLAALAAVLLALIALILAGALHAYRTRREQARQDARRLGRTILAELPAGADLVFFAEDSDGFYYGERRIAKTAIRAVCVLINGAPIAAWRSTRFPEAGQPAPAGFADQPEGIARDRWDVAIETAEGTELVMCGAIRERVSQELARKIFNAVKEAVEHRDRTA